MKPQIAVRQAEVGDAEYIARAVALAIGSEEALRAYCGEDYLSVLADVARSEATQYSYRYALVAEVEGRVAGAVVGYDGAQLGVLRAATFAIIGERVGREPVIPDETEAGEYYLDSVAVWEEFRGCGVGQSLVSALCRRAFAEGHDRVGLIVDYGNPQAERLYQSMGFRRIGSRTFFGHKMWHLQKMAAD